MPPSYRVYFNLLFFNKVYETNNAPASPVDSDVDHSAELREPSLQLVGNDVRGQVAHEDLEVVGRRLEPARRPRSPHLRRSTHSASTTCTE